MRIGILTLHRAENFGAVLQAYALQSHLLKQGHDVSIIDYRNSTIESAYQILNLSILWSRKNVFISLKKYLSRFRHLRERTIVKRKYTRFREQYLHLSSPFYHIDGSLPYDACIVGSDQVWNFYLLGKFDSAYFLDFPMASETRRVAYAASSDNDPLNLYALHEVRLKRALSAFNAISVREEFLKQKIQSLVSIPVKVCVDPTFFLSRAKYRELSKKPEEQNYILVYYQTPSDLGIKIAEKISARSGCNVVKIYGGYYSNCAYKKGLGPLEILGYIEHADLIITTSFHGLALSLILEKNVWVINQGDNLRQKYLLDISGLTSRLISNEDDFSEDAVINFAEVSSKMSNLIAQSMFFLQEALS